MQYIKFAWKQCFVFCSVSSLVCCIFSKHTHLAVSFYSMNVDFCCRRESKVRIHNHSVLATPPADNYKSSKLSATPGIVEQLPTDWLVYEEITRAHRLAQVKCCTVMSPVTMAIFAGAAKLPYEAVQEAEGMSEGWLNPGGFTLINIVLPCSKMTLI